MAEAATIWQSAAKVVNSHRALQETEEFHELSDDSF